MSTLITNIAELMTQDTEHRVLKDAAVVIEGERISWIGPASSAPAADDAVDAGGRAVTVSRLRPALRNWLRS